jgi:hypothetical protein
MNTRFLTVLITLTFLGFSVTVIAKGRTNPEVVYTAVMAGNFNFPTMELTARKKGKSLSGNDTLKMNTDTDAIFKDKCSDLLGEVAPDEVGVVGFDVPNWSISHTKSKGRLDQIHLTMNNLTIYPAPSTNYSQVDFDLHLHGEIGELDDFLPDARTGYVDHTLTNYMLWAGGRGEEGWFVCNSTGNGIDTWLDLPADLTLTITRKP